MSQSRTGYIDQNARSNWMRLRTLVTVRWVAITGQILALAVGQELYGLRLLSFKCLQQNPFTQGARGKINTV